jgi:hypothetical protein
MRRAELQLSLFAERLPFASGLPIGLASSDRKKAISLDFAAAPLKPPGYEAYLRSARWGELRCEALERDKHACRFCYGDSHLQVHHRRYPERWGEETVDDLTTMCAGCHLIFTWFRSLSADSVRRLIRR